MRKQEADGTAARCITSGFELCWSRLPGPRSSRQMTSLLFHCLPVIQSSWSICAWAVLVVGNHYKAKQFTHSTLLQVERADPRSTRSSRYTMKTDRHATSQGWRTSISTSNSVLWKRNVRLSEHLMVKWEIGRAQGTETLAKSCHVYLLNRY